MSKCIEQITLALEENNIFDLISADIYSKIVIFLSNMRVQLQYKVNWYCF